MSAVKIRVTFDFFRGSNKSVHSFESYDATDIQTYNTTLFASGVKNVSKEQRISLDKLSPIALERGLKGIPTIKIKNRDRNTSRARETSISHVARTAMDEKKNNVIKKSIRLIRGTDNSATVYAAFVPMIIKTKQ